MNERHRTLIQDVTRLAADGAPANEIYAKAIEAKKAIWDEVERMQRAINILDGIVPYHAPDAEWELGWVNPTTARPTLPKPPTKFYGGPIVNRADRILALAEEMTDGQAGKVRTSDIAERLKSEGDTPSMQALATAAGNVLTRSGRWIRLGSGLYGAISTEVAVGD